MVPKRNQSDPKRGPKEEEVSTASKMPLFGKKSDKCKSPTGGKDGGKEQDSVKKAGKVPTVEDKYTLKDVLGT